MIYVYSLPPIDFWHGWMNAEQYEASMDNTFGGPTNDHLNFLERAMELASAVGWEGDMTQGPFFTALPPAEGDTWSAVIVGWKQGNNGTTYVASPYALPWLGNAEIGGE
ncbi:hypothetical protein [Rhizobium laguerreae]|uniref:Uncharacterized protein n=1 Tax=Rhizobium laguerreae TaxID=1076926 RepID=A0AAX2QNL5_9HYPH|nr:hypothetical protein [Rhizobium laguerreae]TCU25298.1 hypothetical protein EV131_105412 [Rhizobium laguerreae]